MRSAIRFAMLALVLVIVAMVSALTAMRFAIHGQEVAVPPLVGVTPQEAERAVAGLGLQISIERQYYSPQIPEGRIMSQLPLPGTKVRRGWQVRVAQSLGPTRVSIPDVTGQSEHAAELNIRRRGLDVASMAEVQAPKISLLVTAALDPQAFVMPSFVGQPLGSASRSLQDAGFKLGNVNVVVPASVADVASPSSAPGASAPVSSPVSPLVSSAAQAPPPAQASPASIIVSQAPAAGQKVFAGAAVNFDVR